MKYILLIPFLLVALSGCVTKSPERLEKAQEFEERSQAASERAQAHGELAGTPENIDGIRRAEEQAISSRKSTDDAKYNDTLFDLLISILKD